MLPATTPRIPRQPSPADPVETAARAEYLYRIDRCAHSGPRRPGSCCGGCGREWSEIDLEGAR